MVSKAILLLLALLSLIFGSWAGLTAFADTTQPISTLAMMGMMGYLFHGIVILASLSFPLRQRKVLTLLLLTWHIPEAILIATLGMGIPQAQQFQGVIIHSSFSLLALLSWWLAKEGRTTE